MDFSVCGIQKKKYHAHRYREHIVAYIGGDWEK